MSVVFWLEIFLSCKIKLKIPDQKKLEAISAHLTSLLLPGYSISNIVLMCELSTLADKAKTPLNITLE